MLIRKSDPIRSSEITPESAFHNRRQFLTSSATLGAGAIASSFLPASAFADDALKFSTSKYTLPDAQTPVGKATSYNNFYEFGVEKDLPAKNAHTL